MPQSSPEEPGFPDLAEQLATVEHRPAPKRPPRGNQIPLTGVILVASIVIAFGAFLNYLRTDPSKSDEKKHAIQERFDEAKQLRDTMAEFVKQVDVDISELEQQFDEQQKEMEKRKGVFEATDEESRKEGANRELLAAKADGQWEAVSVCLSRLQDTKDAIRRIRQMRTNAEEIRSQAQAAMDAAAVALGEETQKQ
jgi:hypothetical protein